jgi:hypothetical protein
MRHTARYASFSPAPRSPRSAARAAGAGALGTGHFAGRNFSHNGFHGPFTHPFRGFRGFSGYGWYGPVFWPYAYDVLFADLFWGSAYGYPFWDYGYSEQWTILALRL